VNRSIYVGVDQMDALPYPDCVNDARLQRAEQIERELASAAHHRASMVDRRGTGLRIIVGVVSFDLVLMKLATDAASHVTDHHRLGTIVRVAVAAAYIVMAGMLIQLETRSRRDRQSYWWCERRADAIRRGEDPDSIPLMVETRWQVVRNSWATTWALGGVAALAGSIWLFAGILR
jgi:hypothetical protein